MIKFLSKLFKKKSAVAKVCLNCHREQVNSEILKERIDRYEERLKNSDKEFRVMNDNMSHLEDENESISEIYEELVENICLFIEELEKLPKTKTIDDVLRLIKKHRLTNLLSRNIQ